MNIIISIKDFNLGLSGNAFFESANISDGNYDDDIDHRIDAFLSNYRNRHIQSFTIPISLSNNFMELSGLILANHVRLTRELTFCEAPIIFYGSLELEQLLRLTPLARILLTSNVQYVNINKYSFDDIQKTISIYEKKPFDLNQFLEQIQINPPSNYDSHHSVDNEFALIQWSTYTKCINSLPPEFKKEFNSRLYFKYLRVKNTFSKLGDNDQIEIATLENTRILLVDDEANKGWEIFYKSFLKNSNIKFEDSGIDFKNEEKDYIIAKVESKVKEFNPDVVLLDLRLHDSDFGEEEISKNLTGIKILEKIKGINKGIQVIITTASNKAWNFNLAKQKGAFEFIIKDGFESPDVAINKLKHAIENASNRSFYLKPIYEKMFNSLSIWTNYSIPERKNINDSMHDSLWHLNLKLQVNDFVKNAFDTIDNDSIVERFTISTLLLYRVIEMINEFYIIESGDNRNKTNKYHFDQDNSLVPKINYTQNKYSANFSVPVGTVFSTKDKMYAIFYKINGSANYVLFNKIHKLTNYRNKVTIHPSMRFKEESLEYIYDSDFRRFSSLLNEYFSAILDYINFFK